jgi:hypothetical protein
MGFCLGVDAMGHIDSGSTDMICFLACEHVGESCVMGGLGDFWTAECTEADYTPFGTARICVHPGIE